MNESSINFPKVIPEVNQTCIDRFWSKVAIAGPDECWNWKAGLSTSGYGRFYAGNDSMVCASRFAWTVTNGSIPNSLLVLHKCDNPACVNPSHLFLGTDADNTVDMHAKHRQARGEKNGSSKLNAADIIQIRQKIGNGETQSEIAREFKVTRQCIWQILRRDAWGHVGKDSATSHPRRRVTASGNRVFNL